MNLKHIQHGNLSLPQKLPPIGPQHYLPAQTGHSHFWQRATSRRQLLKTAAATAAGLVLGSGLWKATSVKAQPPGAGEPIPIPGGSPIIEELFGQLFHLFVPGGIDPQDAEPSTITDFVGFIGHALMAGMGTRKNLNTGATARHPFDCDMRFMKGVFIGTDRRMHRGTFAFI